MGHAVIVQCTDSVVFSCVEVKRSQRDHCQISTLGGIFARISGMYERILMKLITVSYTMVSMTWWLYKVMVQWSRSQTTFS